MLSLRRLLFSCLFFPLALLFQCPVSAQKYTLTDLGSLSDRTTGFESSISSVATAINNKGWVTGYAATPHQYGVTHAFLWKNGVMQDLSSLTPNGSTKGVSINSHGQIVGSERAFGSGIGSERPFIYSDGKIVELGSLPELLYAHAQTINDKGDIAGCVSADADDIRLHSENSYRSCVWHKGKMTVLGTLPGLLGSAASGINQRGQMTGGSGGHIILYDKGKVADLGCLPGFHTSGSAINDKEEIVGTAYLFTPSSKTEQATVDNRVVLYRNHVLTDLMLPHGKDAEILSASINNHSQIVCTVYDGMRTLSGIDGRGCLYSEGKWTDLNTLIDHKSGWVIREANGINDAGQIVGAAIHYGPGKLNGVEHAVLLTLVK